MANLQASLTMTRIRMLCCWAKHFIFPVSLSTRVENCQNISRGGGEVGSVCVCEGERVSLAKLASHPGHERGLVMKPDKFFVVRFCSLFRPWPCTKCNLFRSLSSPEIRTFVTEIQCARCPLRSADVLIVCHAVFSPTKDCVTSAVPKPIRTIGSRRLLYYPVSALTSLSRLS